MMGIGAEDRARTGHPDLGKVVLYQMSYFRLFIRRSFNEGGLICLALAKAGLFISQSLGEG